MRGFLRRTRKAAGVAVTLGAAWGTAVIYSESGPITTDEWAALIPIGVAIAACYGLTNEEKPEPAPEVEHEPEPGPEQPSAADFVTP